MKHLSIDIETYSDIDLMKSGVYPYSESENFEILLFAYSADFGPVTVIDLAQGEEVPWDIRRALLDSEVIKHAYNAPFEIQCLNAAGYETPAEQWRCTMFHALYCGYCSGLAKTGEALRLPKDLQKSKTGTALINFFSKPCKPTRSNGNRTRNLPHHDPSRWQLFKDYCAQDVIAETGIHRRLEAFPVPESEQALWVLEQRIHDTGIPVDIDLIDGALAIRAQTSAEITQEALDITGLDNPNSNAQLLSWLNERGIEADNMQKATRETLYDNVNDPQIRRVLEIKQSLSSTSIDKYDAFKSAYAGDGRIHGAHQIYGANRTGRWAGRIIQPQNLPRNYIPALSTARDLVKAGDVNALRWIYGSVAVPLSQLLRTVIVPSKDKLIVADYSAIEARVIAWLADERWVLEEFAGDGKIYEATAAKMFGVDKALIKKGNPEYELRQKGKVATLALGYQGAEGALKQMGALEMGIPEEELTDIKLKWREANPNIVNLWRTYESAALECMYTAAPQVVGCVCFRREGELVYGQDFLTVELPSGRKLYYAKPVIRSGKFGNDQIYYQNSTNKGMQEADTYGGKLTENIVQAIARDCLAESLTKVAKTWDVIMHVHDEIVVDVNDSVTVQEICDVMGEPISWAPGLYLKAAGFEAAYYQKD